MKDTKTCLTHKFVTLGDKPYDQLKKMNLALSCSCGKDSVALALCCYMDNIPIKYIIRYDNDSDWDCMNDVWARLKDFYKDTDTQFIVLQGTPLLDQIKQKHYYTINGKNNYGFVPCGIFSRFGTNEKIKMCNDFANSHNCVQIVGIASDENRYLDPNKSYYLIEKNMMEKDCLELCYKFGFDWLQETEIGFKIRMYDFCTRLSCIYCSFSNCSQLALIYHCFPSVWKKIIDIQNICDVPFKDWSSAYNLPLRLTTYIDNLKLQLKLKAIFD